MNELLTYDLTDTQEKALMALMAHSSIRDAAKAIGVSEATIHRYKREVPAFREAYRQIRQDTLDQARRELESLALTACRTFRDVMVDPTSSATARVAAARSVWTLITRSVDDQEIEALLDQLKDFDPDA